MDILAKNKTEIGELRNEVLSLDETRRFQQRFNHVREIRLGKTVADPEADPEYPTDGNTFPVMFVDAEFPPTAGLQVPTVTLDDATVKPNIWVMNVTNEYVPEGTVVVCYLIPGLDLLGDSSEWWMEKGTSIQGIKFRNDSTYTVPAHGVMEVTGWDEDELAWIIGRPSGTFRRRYLINGATEIEYDADPKNFGYGTWLEKADKVLLNPSTSLGGSLLNQEWGAKKDEFYLVVNRPGFMVLDAQDVDGAKVAKAIQREVTELIGKLYSGTITKGSTGSVVIWAGASGSEAALEFDAITCRARFAAIAASKWCVMGWRNNAWIVSQVEC